MTRNSDHKQPGLPAGADSASFLPTACGSRDAAIIGMACLLPGAANLQQFWENVISKTCSIGDPPSDWNAERYCDPLHPSADRTYCVRGGYLGDLSTFDPLEFGVMPNSLDGGEPDHFLTLSAAKEALRDAGYWPDKVDPQRTEVILGRGTYINRGVTNLYQHVVVVEQTLDIVKQLRPDLCAEELGRIKDHLCAQLPPFKPETIPSLIPNILAGRIANRLNLMGSNFIVDAACASSLVALELGMNDLLAGKCDLAIVGGVNTTISPATMILFSSIEALSRRGQLRAFDKEADGTLLGEGLGIIVIKRREDAERDGDRIYALVKGVGIASDGQSQGLLAPRLEGQVLAMRRAYQTGRVAPESVGLIEAHGTGVPLGDATELQSLKEVFAGNGGSFGACNVGTVKANIGHLLTASGMAGLIKIALALYHRVLPPTAGCDTPNPSFELENSPLYINTRLRPWVHGSSTPRRGGVNAFGFGGINSHAILEEAPHEADTELVHIHRKWDSELLLLCGNSRTGLIDEAQRARQALSDAPDTDLINFAWEMNRLSGEAAETLAIICSSVEDLKKKLEYSVGRLKDPACKRIRENEGIYYFAEPLGGPGRVAFVFPGEGSQYADMLADLCVHFPEVRECFDTFDRIFLNAGRKFLPSQTVFPSSHDAQAVGTQLWAMDTGSESVFIASLAIAKLLELCEIKPNSVVGHSAGEYAALVTSGALLIDDQRLYSELVLGVNRVFEQCRCGGQLPEGVMLAVNGANSEVIQDVVRQSGGRIHTAMENCSQQWVLCGQDAEINAADAALREHGAMCMRLPFNRAYHTPLFGKYSTQLRNQLNEFEVQSPRIETYSCVTAAPFPTVPDEIRDLMAVQWSRKVRFSETVQAMYDRGVRIFIEAGPRANLTGFIDNILGTLPHLAVASNVHFRSGIKQFQHLLGLLHGHHVKFNSSILYRHRCRATTVLGSSTSHPDPSQCVRVRTRISNLLPRLRIGKESATSWRAPTNERVSGSNVATNRAETTRQERLPKGARASMPVSSSRNFPAPCDIAPTKSQRRRPNADPSIIAEFLATMREHAQVEAKVCKWFLQAHSMVEGGAAHKRQRLTSTPPPFIDEILAVEPGQRAVAVCRLDLHSSRFLRDHALGGRVSHAHPELVGLPIVPLTFSMELMAECAKLLAPGKYLVGMRDVRAYRWIGLDSGVKSLEIIATTIETANQKLKARCQIREIGELDRNVDYPVVEAEVLLSGGFSTPAPIEQLVLQSPRESGWSGRDLYGEFMFHGPTLQAVDTVDQCGDNGITATLRTLPSEPLRDGWSSTTLECDPILLDAAGQVVAFWSSDALPNAYHIFPFRLEAIDLYGPPLPAGVVVNCHARVELCGEMLIRSDIDILDPTGLPHMRLKGWWDQRFCMPANYERLLADPLHGLLSETCDWAVQLIPGALPAVCTICSALSQEFLDAHDQIWERALAHLVLSEREREHWCEMMESRGARRNWLAGRVAAKDAIRVAVKESTGESLFPADIEVLNDSAGKPYVQYLVADKRLPKFSLSLAHTYGTGVAIAVDAGETTGIGIDAEYLRDLEPGFGESAFLQEERQWIDRLPPENRNAAMIESWCVKEAAAKAFGLGPDERPIVCGIDQRYGPTASIRLPIATCNQHGLASDLHKVRIVERDNLFLAISNVPNARQGRLAVQVNVRGENP
jgi:acyl transferase domain-containing protein/phosphopantetheinyl transferase (holo-ACP synthase)